jgi:hypothetical protein
VFQINSVTLDHMVATMPLDHMVATMTLDKTIAFDSLLHLLFPWLSC